MRALVRRFVCPFIVLLIGYFAIQPILQNGFFPVHDDAQPSRVFEMAYSLRNGQFPVRWVEHLGYGSGYPLYNFYAPLPYYVGAFFYLTGIDVINSTKIMYIVGILLATLSMFLLSNSIFGEMGGILSSVLYTYAPYHAVNIYVRGAVGEYYAYAFLPLVLYGLIGLIRSGINDQKNEKNNIGLRVKIVAFSIGLAGVLLSHNILGMLTIYLLLLTLVIYLLFNLLKHRKLRVLNLFTIALILGIGISSFFTIPALTEKSFTQVDKVTKMGSDFHNHFVYLDQLWDSPWGFAGSAKGRDDGMSFKIGKLHILVGMFSLLYCLYLYKKKRINNSLLTILISFFALLLLSVVFMIEQSKGVWNLLWGFKYIQYPWRLLNFACLSLSVLSSGILLLQSKALRSLILVILTLSVLYLNIKYFMPNKIIPSVASNYIGKKELFFNISKISDEYMPKNYVIPRSTMSITGSGFRENDDLKILGKSILPTNKEFQVIVSKSSIQNSNINFFPGWTAYIDNEKREITNIDGKINIYIPTGKHTISFIFSNTPIRTLSNVLSIISLFLLIYIALFRKKIIL